MALEGKGFFIWKLPNCEGNDANAIASLAYQANYTHILIKIADGIYPNNVDSSTHVDYVPPVRDALRRNNIQVWGWHYVYGGDPVGEARQAIQRLQGLNLDGYVIDAESEYKKPGRAAAARTFMAQMRAAFPNLPMALSSFRFPSYHPQLPWKEFLTYCDYNMPQVYWEQAHNPGVQLTRCVQEFLALNPFRPIIPTGPTYKTGGWAPTEADILQFFNTARMLNSTAVNFFSWDECRRDLPNLWKVISSYPWGQLPPPIKDMPELLVDALNSHDLNKILALYYMNAVHVDSTSTIQGQDAIRQWYTNLFTYVLPNSTFNLMGFTGTGNSRQFTWNATSDAGKVLDGNDTLGLLEGQISYHFTSFTVTPG